MIHTKGFN